jgi:hypothetical protein
MGRGSSNRLETWVQNGNLVQAIAVLIGIAFALWEFVLKDRELIRMGRETTIRLALNEHIDEKDATAFHYLVNHLQCKQSDSDVKWDCARYKDPPEGLSDYVAMWRVTRPVYQRLSRIAVCTEARLCDAELSRNLICPEVRMLTSVNKWLHAETGVATGYGVPLFHLIKECESHPGMMW